MKTSSYKTIPPSALAILKAQAVDNFTEWNDATHSINVHSQAYFSIIQLIEAAVDLGASYEEF